METCSAATPRSLSTPTHNSNDTRHRVALRHVISPLIRIYRYGLLSHWTINTYNGLLPLTVGNRLVVLRSDHSCSGCSLVLGYPRQSSSRQCLNLCDGRDVAAIERVMVNWRRFLICPKEHVLSVMRISHADAPGTVGDVSPEAENYPSTASRHDRTNRTRLDELVGESQRDERSDVWGRER